MNLNRQHTEHSMKTGVAVNSYEISGQLTLNDISLTSPRMYFVLQK